MDVGTSALKIGVYTEEGRRLASARLPYSVAPTASRARELDPRHVWEVAQQGLREVCTQPELKANPPTALAISASGDEVFPVSQSGEPLGPCILSADARGAEIEEETRRLASPEAWYSRCGHVPERMDPANRILWWIRNEPRLASRARYFLGWHAYLTLRLCGLPVTDRSLAAKWATYDLATDAWSDEFVQLLGLKLDWLPAVLPSGAVVGQIAKDVAQRLGAPSNLLVAVGGYDSCCAALGVGARPNETWGLACGTWQVLTAPVDERPQAVSAEDTRLPVVPFLDSPSYALLAQNPNGGDVLRWAATFLGEDLDHALEHLEDGTSTPGRLLSIPHLAGAISTPGGARAASGAVLGIDLSTEPSDLLKSLCESITFELAIALERFAAAGFRQYRRLRATGGCTRSSWWLQLKADVTGIDIETVDHVEAGTLGAALLAGVANGTFDDAAAAAANVTTVSRRFEPNPARHDAYRERLALYKDTVASLLPIHRRLLRDAL